MAVLAVVLGLADASAARAQGFSRVWTVSGSFRQMHSSNLFPFSENGPADVIGLPSASVSYLRTDAHTSVLASGSVYALRFRDQTQYGRLGATFILGGSHRFSRRVRLGFSLGANDGLPAESLYLTRTLFPQIDTFGRRSVTHLSYDVSPTTIATADLTAILTHFSTAVAIPAVDIDPDLVPPVAYPGLTEPPGAGPIGPLAQIDPSLFALSILASEGVAAGESDLRLFGGGFGLTHSFSPVLSASGWFGYSHISLASGAFSGGRIDLRGSMSREFDPSTRISLVYSSEHNEAAVPNVTNQAFLVQGEKAFNENVKLDASLGAAALDSTRANLGGSLVGGVGLLARRGSSVVRFRFDRTTFQAFGLGRNEITDISTLNVTRLISRRLSAWVYGRFRDSRDPFDPAFSIRLQVLGSGVNYRFRQRTVVGADYSLVHSSPIGSITSIASSIWSLHISYGKAFR